MKATMPEPFNNRRTRWKLFWMMSDGPPCWLRRLAMHLVGHTTWDGHWEDGSGEAGVCVRCGVVR